MRKSDYMALKSTNFNERSFNRIKIKNMRDCGKFIQRQLGRIG
jgi:hypothetical protein